jgi:membrane protein
LDLNTLTSFEQRYLWEPDYRQAPPWQRVLVGMARTLMLLFRDIFHGDISLRAMSLVYTTLLSMVPLLALSF